MIEAPSLSTNAPPSRGPLYLLGAINLVLLAALLLTIGRAKLPGALPGVGSSVILFNDLLTPMSEITLSHQGGNFSIPRLEPGRSAGTPITASTESIATLKFRDEEDHSFEQDVTIRPFGDSLILIHILPVGESAEVTLPGGSRHKVLIPSRDKVRALVSYQSESLNH